MEAKFCIDSRIQVLEINRKSSISAFGRKFRFRLAQEHSGKISLPAGRAIPAGSVIPAGTAIPAGRVIPAEMLNFGRNDVLLAEKGSFGGKSSFCPS